MKKKIIIFLIFLIIIFVGIVSYKDININNKEIYKENMINENTNEIVDSINESENNTDIVEESDVQLDSNVAKEDYIKNENDQIQNALSPKGFIGSSLKRVTLYSNGDVYLLNYDGSGYSESNITSKELIAEGASRIEYKNKEYDFESIVIKGKDVKKINTNYSWIEFEI